MKLLIFAVCCFILTTDYTVQGGLVKDFFGKVKETAEVVHKDVQQIWRPESDKNSPEQGEKSGTTSTAAPSAADGQTEKKEDSKVVTEKSPIENGKKTDDSATPNLTTAAIDDKNIKQEETTTVSSSTTTQKEGRENFSGGCQSGYKRTADGRCMATF